MSDATYNSKVYKDDQSDRLVVSTGGRLYVDGGFIKGKVREARICSSSGDLPVSGTAVLGNSSAAIIRYQLPVPESCYVGCELTLHHIAFDDTINSSTHYYVATSSGNSYAVGTTTATNAVIWDSTFEYPFTIRLQAASTNLWKAFLPCASGIGTGLVFGTTLTT